MQRKKDRDKGPVVFEEKITKQHTYALILRFTLFKKYTLIQLF